MDEEKKLTAFEQAFFDYREAQRSIEDNEEQIANHEKWLTTHNQRARDRYRSRAEALAELKRHMTPEAFAELTGAEKAVTP